MKCNLFGYFAVAFILCLILTPSCLFAADTKEVSTTGEISIKLPEVKDFKTSEVCVIKIGKETESVALGAADTPAFPSNGPSSFAVDKKGNVYLLDTMNFKILIISKEGKVIKVIPYPAGESSDTNEAFFIRDIAISPKDNSIYLLNYTNKNIFILSPTGEVKGDIDIKEQIKKPHKMFAANDGTIYVKDEESFDVVAYSHEGKVLGRLQGYEVSYFPDEDGYLYTLGEKDQTGQDIVLLDSKGKGKPKVFGKMMKVITNTEPYDYQILGVDAKNNFFASIVERIQEDVIQTIIYKFGPDGKVLSRLRV
ncbi:MAG TPA: hypothetical protein PKK26_12930, partial [Candidatus Wallbacteria bacterium]|nr:hypothetical protein [Candidatus Wallbacteria bacterium]